MVIAPGYIDERGYTDPVRAREYHEGERAKMAKDPKGLMIYQAEFCFNAEEAFALEGDNKFNKVVLSNLLASIRIHGLGPKIETGYLKATYKGNNADRKASEIVDLHWIEGDGGDVHIIEHPIWSNNYKRINEEGEEEKFELMSNLYVAGIDSIDMGNDLTSDYTDDPSKFCIVIKKRARGVDPPMYVAYYLARPDKIRDAYLTAMKLMMYYNCRCNIEASRITMIQWAKLNEVLLYFINRPRATYPDPTKKVSKLIGTPATKYIIDHQTDLIANYVEDYGEHIWFPEMLDLLIRYNDENKGKFDIVAALGMVELADEEYTGVVPRIVDEEAENKWSDVGYYRDEKGVLHYGVRQIQRELKVSLNTEQDFTTRNRTSNPRYYVYD